MSRTARTLGEKHYLHQSVLPIPPLQTLFIVALVRGKIYGTSEDIQQASIDLSPLLRTPFEIEPFGIFAFQVFYGSDAELVQVIGNALSDARYFLKLFDGRFLSTRHKLLASTGKCQIISVDISDGELFRSVESPLQVFDNGDAAFQA